MTRFLIGTIKLSLKVAVLVSLIAVIVGYARLSDVDGLKTALETHFKDRTGRKLSVNGAIGLDLAFPPRITAVDVSLENAPWGSRKNMMTAKRIEAEVDLLPLVMGDVAVPRLRVVGVDLLLETNKNGDNNWDDLAGFDTAAGPMTDFTLMGAIFGAGAISVAGGVVAVLSAATGQIISLPLPGGNIVLETVTSILPGC